MAKLPSLSKRFFFLLIAPAALIALVLYVYWLNSHSAQFSYRPGIKIELPMAVILFATFLSGALVSSLVALAFGIRHKLEDWRLNRALKIRELNSDQMITARNAIALHDHKLARSILTKIIHREPKNIIARVLLSETMVAEGELKSALQAVEEAREQDRTNIELLLLAGSINSKLGNQTASLDNMTLAFKSNPENSVVLRQLVNIHKELGRYDEAVEHQKYLLRGISYEERERNQEILAELELLKAKKAFKNNHVALKQELQDILRRHKDYPPALSALASLEIEEKNFDAASKYWTKAYTLTHDVHYLEPIASLWLKADKPDKALAVVKNSIGNSSESFDGKLFFIQLLLHLNHTPEAKAEFEKLNNNLQLSHDSELKLRVLEAKIFTMAGDFTQSCKALGEVAEETCKLPGNRLFKSHPVFANLELNGSGSKTDSKTTSSDQLSPMLSTP